MNLFRLLRRAPPARLAFSLFLCLVAPAFLVLAYLMGWGVLSFSRQWHPYATFGFAAFAIAAFGALHSLAMKSLHFDVEEALVRVRANVLRLLVTSELPVIRGVGSTEIASVVAADALVVAACAPVVVLATVQSSLVIIALIITSFESLVATGCFILIMAVAYAIQIYRGESDPAQQGDAAESRFRAVFADWRGGPRELVVDRPKASDLSVRAAGEAAEAARQRSIGGAHYTLTFLSTEVLLLFAILVVHRFSAGMVAGVHVSSEILILIVTVSGPLIHVMHCRYALHGGNRAARRILALEAGLQTAPRVPTTPASFQNFGELQLKDVLVTMPPRSDAESFVLGPVGLSIRRGSVTIVQGPNGSGKSTLLHVLLGLIRPQSGHLLVDGNAVDINTLDAYRQLFSVVFAKPHLFDKMYGKAAEIEAAQAWLTKLGVADLKADVSSRMSAALSTGQRKRLALARALAEARPILVLDEYTADQDPASRERFLSSILPLLKAEGRTVIAVLHGVGAPACADHVFHIADGKVTAESFPTPAEVQI